MPKTYRVNEVFYSIQGEGVRAGTPNVFIRFTGCNLKCSGKEVGGVFQPLCDTEFASGRDVTLDELSQWCAKSVQEVVKEVYPDGFESLPFWENPAIILTGGEPGLQIDDDLIDYFHDRGVCLAVETNGTIELSDGLDWISLSPKVAEHALRQKKADELRYVRGYGQGIPIPSATASHYLISPHFEGNHVSMDTLNWCMKLVRENPQWRLSLQLHKFLQVR